MRSLKEALEEGRFGKLLSEFESQIRKRGENYAKEGRVLEAHFLTDNYLHGRVEGTYEYVVDVFLYKGRLYSNCTCPYGSMCKHAVALLLSFSIKSPEPKKESMDLKTFVKKLKKPLYEYGLLEFKEHGWLKVIKKHDREEILNFLIEFTRRVDEDYEEHEIPYIEEEPLCLDKLVAPFIRSLPKGLRGEYFYRYLKETSEGYFELISTPGLIFKSFSEKDRKVFKSLVEKDKNISCKLPSLAFVS